MKPQRVWKHVGKKTLAAFLAAAMLVTGAPSWNAPRAEAKFGAPDERAVSVTDDVMTRLVERGDYALKNNSLPFRWQVLHKDEFNAYCDYADHVCVYDKLVAACHYQEDELAAVLAHEMAHGYNQHVARDAQKTIVASMLSDVALDAFDVSSVGVGSLIPEVFTNFLVVKNTSVASEKRADESGFYTMASAGFNPGGIAKGFHDCENFAAWSFRTDGDGTVDFLDENAAYAPLKAALAASGTGAKFQTLVERAYASDAASGARDKWLRDERAHANDVAKEREKQAKAKDDAPKKSENGDMYLELGLTSFAAKEYARSSALDAGNPAATCGLAMVAGREGATDEALAMVEDVLAQHAGYARAFVARADIHRSMGDDEAALADCDAALAADADAFVAHRIAGNIYDERGDTAAALAAYRAYHEAVPTACDIPVQYITQIVDGIAEDAGEE